MKHVYCIAILLLFCCAGVVAQDKFITAGSGGGIAGTASVYKITPDGKVFKGHGIGEIKYTECGKIKKAQAKRYLHAVSAQTQSAGEFNHPGNLYYFISSTEKGTTRSITWGDAGHEVPASIRKLYEEINTVVHAVRYKPVP